MTYAVSESTSSTAVLVCSVADESTSVTILVLQQVTVNMQLADMQVAVFGGGSFGTAIGCALARQKPDLTVTLLLRDPQVSFSYSLLHCVADSVSILHEESKCSLLCSSTVIASSCLTTSAHFCAAPHRKYRRTLF